MNPLGLQAQRFVVAEDSESGRFLGCGQLAPLGSPHVLELRSLIVEPESRCALHPLHAHAGNVVLVPEVICCSLHNRAGPQAQRTADLTRSWSSH